MPKLSDPETEVVYDAADQFVEGPLRRGLSLFTPDQSLWRGEPVEELHRCYVDEAIDEPKPFDAQLREQFSTASDEAIQLLAEVLYVHFLTPRPEIVAGETKRSMLQTMLDWTDEPVSIPPELDRALQPGLAATGIGFTTLRFWMVRFLVKFAVAWEALAAEEQERLLGDPWAFREMVFGIDTQKSQGQRHALLHLVFPGTFEPLVSQSSKQQIASRFEHFVDEEDANLDAQLIQIRETLTDELGREFDSFHDPEIQWRWESDQWGDFLNLAATFYDWDDFEEVGRADKRRAAEELAEVREALFTGPQTSWIEPLESALVYASDLVGAQLVEDFLAWCDDQPEEAEDLLRAIWDDDRSAFDRVEGFVDDVPASATGSVGTRLALATLLLMGVDPARYPLHRTRVFRRAYEMVDNAKPSYDDPVESYRFALDFLDALTEDLASRGVEVRDRLDAEALVACLTAEGAEEAGCLDDDDREHLARLRGEGPGMDAVVRIFWGEAFDFDCADIVDSLEQGEQPRSQVTREVDAQRGDLVLLWGDEPERGFVAVGRFERSDDVRRVAWKRALDPPLARSGLVEDAVFSRAPFVTGETGDETRVEPTLWRRLLAIRPELVSFVREEADPRSVVLAPFYRRFFHDRREAEWAFETIERTVEILGGSGPDDERFAVRVENRSGPRIALYFHEQRVLAFRTPAYEGPRAQLVLPVREEGAVSGSELLDERDEGAPVEFRALSMESLQRPDESVELAYERGLVAVLEAYDEGAKSPYRRAGNHMDGTFRAVWDADERDRILAEGPDEQFMPEPVTITQVADELFMDETRFRELVGLVRRRKNVVLAGPPAVGKTYVAERLAYGVLGVQTERRIEMTQFHPSYGYANFVGAEPSRGGEDRDPGIFRRFCRRARMDPGNDYVFVADRLHAPDLEEMFGEVLTLVERERRGEDRAMRLKNDAGGDDPFYVPENVYVIATIPSLSLHRGDVSVLRRRFAFAGVEPAFDSPTFDRHLREAGVGAEVRRAIRERVVRLNDGITVDDELGPAYRIGHGYFVPSEEDLARGDEAWFRDVVRYDLEPLLQQYWSGEPENVRGEVDRLLEDFDE